MQCAVQYVLYTALHRVVKITAWCSAGPAGWYRTTVEDRTILIFIYFFLNIVFFTSFLFVSEIILSVKCAIRLYSYSVFVLVS